MSATEKPDRLRVSVLGALVIESGEDVVRSTDLGGRKSRELLEFLLLARNVPVRKEELGQAIWPTKQPVNIRGTIETYVSGLRKRLFDSSAEAQAVLVTSAEGYRFRTDLVDFDLDRFDAAIDAAEKSHSLQQCVALRSEAAALVRGELLEGAPHGDWLTEIRHLTQLRIFQNLLILSRMEVMLRRFPDAVASAEAAIEVQPYAEEAHRLAMIGHYAMGHTASARAAFERCRALVENDLGLDVTSATEDLASAMDAGAPLEEVLWESPASWPTMEIASQLLDPARPELRDIKRSMGCVGRQPELQEISSIIEKSLGGRLSISAVWGASGMGKTFMLNQIDGRYGVLVGRSDYPATASVSEPLPFARVLSDALERRGNRERAEPYVRGPFLRHDDPRSYEALASVIREIGSSVFLLDDVEGADRAFVNTLVWLREHAPDLPLAVVMTSPVDPSTLPAFEGLDLDLSVQLDPFTADEVAALGTEVEEVRSYCGGHPSFTTDLWRWRSIGMTGLPSSLEERVKGVIRALDDAAGSVIETVCADEPARSVKDLTDQLELSAARLQQATGALVDQGLVSVDDQLVAPTPLVHEVVKDVLNATEGTDDAGSLAS